MADGPAIEESTGPAPVSPCLGICLMEMGERAAGEASVRDAARGRPDMAGRAIMSLAVTRARLGRERLRREGRRA